MSARNSEEKRAEIVDIKPAWIVRIRRISASAKWIGVRKSKAFAWT
jgi:hypothetical protein